MGIRLVVVDDNPHVTWEGRTYPVNATFQQFVAGVVDLPGSPVASVTSVVPSRAATVAPDTLPLDPRIRAVGSAPFDGIGGYLRHGPTLLAANRPILRHAITAADLLWLKVPASNGPLAAAIAAAAGVPRFTWVAGSAAEVAAARYHGPRRIGGWLTGLAYDAAGRFAGLGGARLVVGDDIVDGTGVVASLVEPADVRPREIGAWPPAGPVRLAWAGRLVGGKGVERLLEFVAADPGLRLELLGDGPDAGRLQSLADHLGCGNRVSWPGRISDRTAYLERLAAADAFVFPSPAEGFPKVLLDAFAVGLPVLSTRVGAMESLSDAGLVEPIDVSSAEAIAASWRRLRERSSATVGSRVRGATSFARRHTRSAEAARLVGTWQDHWPDLPWGPDADVVSPTA